MINENTHIIICNQRLQFRFGVDRILITLAEALIRRGYKVKLVCNRAEDAVIDRFPEHLIKLPDQSDPNFFERDIACVNALREKVLCSLSTKDRAVLVSGGFPFLTTALLSYGKSIVSIFIDAGAVPHNGLCEHACAKQRQLKKLRALTLPWFDHVFPISQFISESQTLPERGREDGIHVVRLGVDHLDRGVFPSPIEEEEKVVLERLSGLRNEGIPIVMNLGRFAGSTYKNGVESLGILRDLRIHHPDARLVVLAKPDEFKCSESDLDGVEQVGHVGDLTLLAIMHLCCAGVSTSLWEGFNLPMGEMQNLGKPVVAFRVGAHPEVTAHPWFLCSSREEIVRKLCAVIQDDIPTSVTAACRDWPNGTEFTWSGAVSKYVSEIGSILTEQDDEKGGGTTIVMIEDACFTEKTIGLPRFPAGDLEDPPPGQISSLGFIVSWNAHRNSFDIVGLLHIGEDEESASAVRLFDWMMSEDGRDEFQRLGPDWFLAWGRRSTMVLAADADAKRLARKRAWATTRGVGGPFFLEASG